MQKSLQEQIIGCLPNLEVELNQCMDKGLKSKLPVCDIVQDTFLRATERIHSFEYQNGAKLHAWLRTIAKNIIRNRIRKFKNKTATQLGELAETLTESGILSASDIFKKDEEKNLLTAACCRLSDSHREILNRHYVDGLSFEQIGRELQKSSSAIRGLHRNALNCLRKYVHDLFRSD